MLIEAGLLTPLVRTASSAIAILVLAIAIRQARRSSWLSLTERQHVWLGSLVVLLGIWTMRAGISPGLSSSFLLVPTLTLMQGSALALTGIAGVLAGMSLLDLADWQSLGPNFICAGVVPVLFTTAVHRTVERFLPHNYFIYFFVTVFAGSAVAYGLAGAARMGLLGLSGSLDVPVAWSEWVVLLPMLSFAEAFTNGLLMAMAVVYRPQWVMSFDDRLYLARR